MTATRGVVDVVRYLLLDCPIYPGQQIRSTAFGYHCLSLTSHIGSSSSFPSAAAYAWWPHWEVNEFSLVLGMAVSWSPKIVSSLGFSYRFLTCDILLSLCAPQPHHLPTSPPLGSMPGHVIVPNGVTKWPSMLLQTLPALSSSLPDSHLTPKGTGRPWGDVRRKPRLPALDLTQVHLLLSHGLFFSFKNLLIFVMWT